MSVFVGWLVGLFDWLSARVCLSEHLSFSLCSTCLSLSDCLYGRIRDQGFKTGSVHLNVMLSCHVMSLCHLMSSSHCVFLLLFVSGVVFFFSFYKSTAGLIEIQGEDPPNHPHHPTA